MRLDEYRDKLFLLAERMGLDAAETYYISGENFTAGVLEGELERFSCSRVEGLGLRVLADGKNGYAYTQRLVEPDTLIAMAADNLRCIESRDEHPFQSAGTFRQVKNPHNPLSSMTQGERVALALSMEARAKALDARVKRVQQCSVSTGRYAIRLDNTLGLCARRETDRGYCVAAPVIEEAGEVRNAFAFRMGEQAADVEACAREAVEEAVASLGASPVQAGEYRVLLRADAACELLGAFAPMFSADRAQKGLSPLQNSEGERIADACVHIVDDAFMKERPLSFDGEGTPTQALPVVRNGVLLSLLHNLKTAHKAQTITTGHAYRSASTPVSVAPTNFYIAPGTCSREQLFIQLYDGLYITGVSGLHAGVSTVSGQFSLIARGFLVERGSIVRSVEHITIAGYFLDLLKGVETLGGDLRFGLPGAGMIGAPSMLIERLKVAGK